MPIVNGTWLAILLLSTTPRRYCEHQLAALRFLELLEGYGSPLVVVSRGKYLGKVITLYRPG